MNRSGARRSDDPCQLQLEFDGPPRTAEALLARLRVFGLTGIHRCRLTNNRAVMVSFSEGELRVHRGYLGAPPDVHRAVVVFVCGPSRAERHAAQRTILGFTVPTPPRPSPACVLVREEDRVIVREMHEWHRHYSARYFGGKLADVVIRLSGRMRTRLGQYTAASAFGEPAEIAISRSHLKRHGWAESLHTLLHEMVHQWQAENGLPIDHGAAFRAKAREVGIAPNARRELRAALRSGRLVAQHGHILRAARHE